MIISTFNFQAIAVAVAVKRRASNGNGVSKGTYIRIKRSEKWLKAEVETVPCH